MISGITGDDFQKFLFLRATLVRRNFLSTFLNVFAFVRHNARWQESKALPVFRVGRWLVNADTSACTRRYQLLAYPVSIESIRVTIEANAYCCYVGYKIPDLFF